MNGNSSGIGGSNIGGAIHSTGDKLVVSNCNFLNNTAKMYGGAIYSRSALIIINNSNFNENKLEKNNFIHQGAAVYSINDIKVYNSNFTYNDLNDYSPNGEGGAIVSKKSVELYKSNFISNIAGDYTVYGKQVNATRCLFRNNTNQYGSGALVGENVTVDDSDFISNMAGKCGASIRGSYVSVNNSRFINNTGNANTNYLGSGIFSTNELNVSNSYFENNVAGYRGGAILVNGVGNINNCTFVNNTAHKSGGAISGSVINVNNSNFIGNGADKYGGAIFATNATVINSNFTDNYGENNTSIVTITNNAIKNSKIDGNVLNLNLTEVTFANYSGLIRFSNGYYGYCIEPASFTGGSGFATDDLSHLTNSLTGEDVSEYLKIFVWYYYNNENATPSLGGYIPQQYLYVFTTTNFTIYAQYYPPIKKVIDLYDSGFRVPSKNAVKLLDNGSYMVFNFKTFLTPTSYQNDIMFKVDYLDDIDTHMKVEKITVTPVVGLGNRTSFIIRVTNDCNYTLHDVFVVEDSWDDGLVYDSWSGNDDWTYSGSYRWSYNHGLAPNESAEFIVYFNTTKPGNFTNYIIAGSNETGNITTNNSTEVINSTIPENNTNKTDNETNNTPAKPENNNHNKTNSVNIETTPKTGNPLVILLLSILCLGIIPFKKH
ncbi:hypothetical protein [Methanobrevibacter boviskoreani]|uniref:hypothetical protein n=1 Tax=Methanobrevibacter boviskoreani TaxID=1348249 RepID=UPI0005940B3F|nr:hypothetical protein [Methanobrevibacter boviskoreani]